MSATRSSSGSPIAPDFSSAPELTQSERMLIRSFVTSCGDGTQGASSLLLQQVDYDSLWSGEDVFTYCTSRLARIRDKCTDVQLQGCLQTKLHLMEQAWKEKDSTPSFRPYAGSIDAIRAQQIVTGRSLPTYRAVVAPEVNECPITPRCQTPIDVSSTPIEECHTPPATVDPVQVGDTSSGSEDEVRP